jgi:hypothetical protein
MRTSKVAAGLLALCFIFGRTRGPDLGATFLNVDRLPYTKLYFTHLPELGDFSKTFAAKQTLGNFVTTSHTHTHTHTHIAEDDPVVLQQSCASR